MSSKRIGVGTLALLVASGALWTVGLAEGARMTESRAIAERTVVDAEPSIREEQVVQDVDIAPLLERLAQQEAFADWSTGQPRRARTLHDPSGHEIAHLWQITDELNGGHLGYLVSTLDGENVYEYSRRALPELPYDLQGRLLDQGCIYAGPMLHLVYLKEKEGLRLYNLTQKETTPVGELQPHLPVLTPQSEAAPTTVKAAADVIGSLDRALYATGVYGQYKLQAETEKEGVLALRSFVQGNPSDAISYVVYDAVPDKLILTLQVTQVVTQGDYAYVGLQNPFAEPSQPPVYIDSRFPVSVVSLNTSSVR